MLLSIAGLIVALKVSATIITLNEEKHIRAACESVAWADEIVVVDCGSTDGTQKIAAGCGARVIENAWPGFAEQKQFAAEQAQHEWIFSLDADERVSEELKNAIADVRARASRRADGYLVARRAFYMGRWIRGGDWYPDWQLRLYRKSRGRWQGAYVHESVQMVPGTRVEKLRADLLHYPFEDPSDHRRMIAERYAPLAARKLFEQGRRTSRLKLATIGPATFVRNFILKGGFRDGRAGLMIAKLAAHHASLKYQLLWELQHPGADSQDRN